MFIKDPNDQALILLGIKNEEGIFYFPSTCSKYVSSYPDLAPYWGLVLKIDHRCAVSEQIVEAIVAQTNLERGDIKDLNLCSSFRTQILTKGVATSLYLVIKESPSQILPEYKTIVNIINDLPNNKNRISYMFIVQYLSSMNLDEVDALEVGDSDFAKFLDKDSRTD